MDKQQRNFIQHLVNLRDEALDSQHEDLIGIKKAKFACDLLKAYFVDRFERIPIRKPSEYMDCQTFADYINDEVLYYIYEENTEYMTMDWRQLFICKTDYSNSDDTEFL